MARCDEGYRCEVCGRDVEALTDSDLYLRYVLGEVPLELLHRLPERHLCCNPALAQYIVADGFEPVACDGPFDKRALDAAFVAAETGRVTRGWLRLQALPTLGLAVPEYPMDVIYADVNREDAIRLATTFAESRGYRVVLNFDGVPWTDDPLPVRFDEARHVHGEWTVVFDTLLDPLVESECPGAICVIVTPENRECRFFALL